MVIIFWGLNWTVTKIILESIPPVWTTALRALIATCALFIIQLFTRQCIIPQKRDMSILFVIGFFHLTLFTVLMSMGLELVPVGRSVVLGYTTPLWVVPAAIFFLRESINKVKIVGVLLGVLGVLVLINPLSITQQDSSQLFGSVLLLLSSLSWAISIIYTKYYTWYSTPFQLISWQMLLATIILTLSALYFEGIPRIDFTPHLLSLLAYTGLCAAAFGFWAMTEITKKLPAVEVSLGTLLTPIVGIVCSQMLLGEKLDLPLIVGAILILSGVILSSFSFQKK